VGFELSGRAAVPPVLGVEVLGLGDVAGEPHELRAGTASAAAAERVTPCGSSGSSWWATSCRRVEVAAAACCE
jgi:hypothetical protein